MARMSRRSILVGTSALATGAVLSNQWSYFVSGQQLVVGQVESKRSSAPNALKITDLRVASLKDVPHNSTIIRLDTNQGISGWGEVRDGASPTYALMLKSRLLGENPCDVERIFRKLKQFGGHGRAGGGVSGIEMALWDLAGKAYGVPVYQLLGGKYRDRIRVYADTRQPKAKRSKEGELSGKEAGQLLLERKQRGISWLKFDVGIGLLDGIAETTSLTYRGKDVANENSLNPFAGVEITDKGIELLAGYVADIRAVIGMEIPFAIDHLGPLSVNSVIRLAKRLEPYALAWIEDPIPWQHVGHLGQITNSVNVPILTGEDIYLKQGFQQLITSNAVDIIHPDIATAGGILETKHIGDMAAENGIPMVIHCAGTPLQFIASVHCAAASENFLCLEHHGLDVPNWESLVTGINGPLISEGFIKVPEAPGLGVELHEETARKYLAEPGFFEPTPQWNSERTWDRTWS